MNRMVASTRRMAAALCLLLLAGCQPLLAGYSLDAFRNATSLKAEVAALVNLSHEPFAQHEVEARTLTTKIDAAYQFAAAMPQNTLSARQWDLLRGDGLFGGFVATWRREGTVSPAYRENKRAQLDRAFDYISCLEVNKRELKRCISPETADE